MLTHRGLWKNFENLKRRFAKTKYCVAFPQETRLEFWKYFSGLSESKETLGQQVPGNQTKLIGAVSRKWIEAISIIVGGRVANDNKQP